VANMSAFSSRLCSSRVGGGWIQFQLCTNQSFAGRPNLGSHLDVDWSSMFYGHHFAGQRCDACAACRVTRHSKLNTCQMCKVVLWVFFWLWPQTTPMGVT
jgi:hypothetical protein